MLNLLILILVFLLGPILMLALLWLSKWLSSAVGDPVKVSPMVTIPGWYVERKAPDGIPVLNPKQVRTYLDAKKEGVLSESMIKRICHQLEQKCRDVDLWDWY